MAEVSLPMPPPDLAARVGTVDGVDPLRFYRDEGRRLRDVIEQMLPDGWNWNGKRALDFGCGSARVLRHFADEAERGVFWGCDIDEASIAWDEAHLTPPFQFFQNALAPPLPLQPGSLDLIWAMSVFTHITDAWGDWLVEMHRLLAKGGVLIASFLGEGMWEPLVGEPYREDEVGMSVMGYSEGPDAWVFHSDWWLREHWGRAFDVLKVQQPSPSADGSPQITHSYIALRKRDLELTKEDLERVNPAEPRELSGLQTSLRLARRDIASLSARIGEGRDGPGLRPLLRKLRRSWSGR